MEKKDKKASSAPKNKDFGCCKVVSVVSVDERGQMVLPKEIREKAKIRSGDKLAVISMETKGKLCCISLIKSDDFEKMVKGLLAPMMKEMIRVG